MNKIERQRQHFDSVAERYYRARMDPNHLCLKRNLWGEVFLRLNLEIPDRPRVLEPMCGFAEGHTILDEHLSVPFDYHGFDYSDVVVYNLRSRHPDLRVDVADVTSFVTDKTYDIVVLIGGLHHVPDHAGEVVLRMASYLNPGGYFISLEPTHGNWLFRQVRNSIYERNSLFDEKTERAFAVKELLAFFEQAGLEDAFTCYPGLLAYILYYNPDAFPVLNKGNTSLVDRLFRLERPFYSSFLSSVVSFATLSVWRKPKEQIRSSQD